MKILRGWWPSIVVLIVILWLTLAPHPIGDTQIELFPGADKLVHAIMMGGLASALLFDWRRNGGRMPYRAFTARTVCMVIVAVTLFSVADEIAQQSMQLGRSGDVFDVIADFVGILLGVLLSRPVISRIFRDSRG
ncbi:MAG: VanZ family protein [Muribaculaceae bacterium]|nr:VanZ family protein [Muribaculaceae bacterium]